MISIIIVHYNAIRDLKECLTALENSNIDYPFEIIIVDNASAQSIKNLIQSFARIFKIYLIENRMNTGYAHAVNQGIRKSRGKYLLIINPDISITAQSVEKMIEFMDKEKRAGIIAPALVNPDGTIQYTCFRFPKLLTPLIRRSFLKFLPFGKNELKRYLMLDFNHDTIREVDWVLGAAMMVKRQAVEKVGMMDERFFLYFEDVDWCRRFHGKGYKVIYFPEAKFVHKYARYSAKKGLFLSFFNKYFWLHLGSCMKYFLKWSGT
ncbi:MAG: glycosyltransferase family 2 protein [candidate division WOR-3 bacterium]|nr:glycosyltransferase family 2 protein [candidate division WOR-3 bacterium]